MQIVVECYNANQGVRCVRISKGILSHGRLCMLEGLLINCLFGVLGESFFFGCFYFKT